MRKASSPLLLLLFFAFLLSIAVGYGLAQTEPMAQSEQPAQVEESSIFDGITKGKERLQREWQDFRQSIHYTTSVRVITVGDIMVHDNQLQAAFISPEAGYQFDSYFTEVSPIFAEGDWVLGNLETTLAGSDKGFTGYPQFNSPAELAVALKNAGFNVITTANNHSLDRREVGVLRTLDRLDEKGFLYTGTFRSEAERNEPLLLTKNNITIALFAYTYGTNGIPIPNGKDYLVNLIDLEQMKADIVKARQAGADVIAMAVHFGNEYQREPSVQQVTLVDQLFAAGVDIIYGSHPHVVQPFEIRTWEDEAGKEHQGVVIYSLGNFISDQRGDYKDLGLIFDLTIEKEYPSQKVIFKQVEAIPTYVNRYWQDGKRIYRILPLEQVVKDQGAEGLTAQQITQLEKYHEELRGHVHSRLGENVFQFLRTPPVEK